MLKYRFVGVTLSIFAVLLLLCLSYYISDKFTVLGIIGVNSKNLVYLGTQYGGWLYNESGITDKSVIYSVGLGIDTSWEEGLIKRHNVHVYGFDPTPMSIAYVQNNSKLSSKYFTLTPEGLHTKKAIMKFTKPLKPTHVSMRIGKHSKLGRTIKVQVNTLSNWMHRFGHTHIDILKLDIEGSEYATLQDMVKHNFLPMTQLLLENHKRFGFEKQHIHTINLLQKHFYQFCEMDDALCFYKR